MLKTFFISGGSQTKTCSKCRIEKDESEFHKRKDQKDGLSTICKDCSKAYNAQYRKAHKNELAEKNKQWCEVHKERARELSRKKSKKYRELHKEKVQAYADKYNKEYYSKNKTKVKQQQRGYRGAHKEEKSLYNTQYRKEKPEAERKAFATHRGLGFKPLNNHFKASAAHHIHLENSKDFLVYIPIWDHELNPHKSINPESMTTINSIALDYWVNESLYTELFQP